MKVLIFSLLVCCFFSCSWNEYPPEKYDITREYRELMASYNVGDTLIFQNNKSNISAIRITKIDSSINDKRGYFINSGEYKIIEVNCEELSNPIEGYDKYTLVYIQKNPKANLVYFDFRYKDFFSRNLKDSLVLKKDTLIINQLHLTNYYSFRANEIGNKPTSIAKIYVTKEKGLTAYQLVNGEWWARTK